MERKLTLKAWRYNAGLTQIDLATAIGRNKDTICRWEKGETKPTAKDIQAIESVLGINWSNDILLP